MQTNILEMDRKAQCLVPAESHSKFLLQMCEEANIDITLSESEGPSNNLFPTAMTLRASLIISACEHQVIAQFFQKVAKN